VRELISSIHPEETIFLAEEAIFRARRRRQETIISNDAMAVVRQWSSIMSAIFNLIYREFCVARLAEMRKHDSGGQYRV
jgi:hypothetical protein